MLPNDFIEESLINSMECVLEEFLPELVEKSLEEFLHTPLKIFFFFYGGISDAIQMRFTTTNTTTRATVIFLKKIGKSFYEQFQIKFKTNLWQIL